MLNYIFVLFLNGIFFGSGPCIASCGPLILSFSIGNKKNFKESLKIWGVFSLSRLFVYIIIGLIAGIFNQVVLEKFYSSWFADILFICAGLVIILMGLTMLFNNKIPHNFCNKIDLNLIKKHKNGAAFLGLMAGFLPCAPLLGILCFIALISKSFIDSIVYSSSFGLGTFFSPLFILFIFAGAIPKALSKRPKVYIIFERLSAIIICYLGLSLIFSVLK
jgi:sulfite exporter TauE/SafE